MNFRDFWLSNISAEKPQYKAVFFDVDGTIVSGGMPMPGAESTLQWLREIKTPFLCLTNDSHHSREQKSQIISRSGVNVEPGEIISCSHALGDWVEEHSLTGSKVFIMGEFGTPCMAEAAGLIPCRNIDEIDECSLVIAGEGYFDWHRTFHAVMNYFIRHRDRQMIVPNPDSYWPNARKNTMGIGAGAQARFIAGILEEMKINIQLVYLGKPHKIIFDYALKCLQKKFGISPERSSVLMLGDALFSDIAGARNAGLTPALVMTGVTTLEILEQTPRADVPELVFDTIGSAEPNK